MIIRIKVTSGGEVRFAGLRPSTIYYGAPPETGVWKIDPARLEDYLNNRLHDQGFGKSVETFFFGFEIGDIKGWGEFFTKMTEYVSYRPKMRALVSVAQLDWLDVKELEAKDQFSRLAISFRSAALRVGEMKRKPSDFNYQQFENVIRKILDECPLEEVSVKDDA